MENIDKRLREDAALIRVSVTPELDDRIRASLEGVTPEKPDEPARHRPVWFWFASTLTGTAAALVIIAVLNLAEGPEPVAPQTTASGSPPPVEPLIEFPNLTVRPAMVEALETEFDNLKGDLRRAERVVREDIDQVLGETAD